MKKITAKDALAITGMRERGMSCAAIARVLGRRFSAQTVRSFCLREGVGGYRPRRAKKMVVRNGIPVRPFTAADDRELTARRVSGEGIAQISRGMGRALSSIRNRLWALARMEEGEPLRRRHNQQGAVS